MNILFKQLSVSLSITFKCGRAGYIHLHCQQCGRCRVYPSPPPAVWTLQGVSLPIATSLDVAAGFSLFTASSVDVSGCIPLHSQQCGCFRVYPSSQPAVWLFQGVSLFTANSVDDAGCIPLHRHQCGRCRVYPSPPPTVWTMQGVSLVGAQD